MALSNLPLKFPAWVTITIGLVLLLVAGFFAYRKITQPPPEVVAWMEKNPDQLRPELVGWGISPWLILLILSVFVFAIAGAIAVWRSRASF